MLLLPKYLPLGRLPPGRHPEPRQPSSQGHGSTCCVYRGSLKYTVSVVGLREPCMDWAAGQAFDAGTSVGLEPNRTLAAYAKGRDVGNINLQTQKPSIA